MAPPSNRRSGYSRRAQYGTFFGYMAALAGALVGAVLLAVSVFDHAAFAGLRGLAADAARPAGTAVAVGREQTIGFVDMIGGFLTFGARSSHMAKELELARVRLAEARGIAEENRRLKALLALKDADAVRPIATARLLASTASSTRRFATISAGSRDGVQVGMPVRSPLGLVGRVLETSLTTSRVLLITDTESMVPVHRARDGVAAFASGKGDGTLQLRLINLGINPLKSGDVFVTSGSGGLYRPNIAVGVVMQLTPDGAIARVLSDPTASEFVAVEPMWAETTGMPEVLAPPPADKPLVAPKPKKTKNATAKPKAGAQPQGTTD